METLLILSLVLLATSVFLYIRERRKVALLNATIEAFFGAAKAGRKIQKIALFGSLAFLAFTIWKTRNNE